MDVKVNTTYYNNGRATGWNGYGTIEHECGLHIDIGTGDHSVVEDFYCPHCEKYFEVDWNGII